MFKRRIHKWKLDKNNKQHEMKAVVHLAEERRRQGQSPLQAVQIRGRNVPVSEVVRYFKRRGMKEPGKLLDDRAARSRRVDDDCAPASGSVFQGLPCQLDGSLGEEPAADIELAPGMSCQRQQSPLYDSKNLSSLFPPTLLDRPLSFTAEEVTMETVIGRTEQFFTGWCNDQPSSTVGPSSLMSQHFLISRFNESMHNLLEAKYAAAFRTLDKMFDILRWSATRFDPSTLIFILSAVEILTDYSMHPIAQQLLSYVINLSEIVHGEGHPLRTVTLSLSRVAPNLRSHVIHMTLSNMREVIEREHHSSLFRVDLQKASCQAIALREAKGWLESGRAEQANQEPVFCHRRSQGPPLVLTNEMGPMPIDTMRLEKRCVLYQERIPTFWHALEDNSSLDSLGKSK
jgi:hypothetical protein